MTTSSEPKRAQSPATAAAAEDAFVGRRQELKAIGSSLEAAASGDGRLEIVSGPPGIGKTRLTHEVAAIARARGFYVLRGGCWEGEGAPAYWPWADVLRSHLSGLSEDVTGTAGDFSQLLEIAATRAAVPVRGVVDATKDAQQARFMLFDRFCEFLAATAAPQPLLVIIDDAQSADTGSLLLLQFLAGRLAKLPIAVVITSRDPLSEMTASTGRHAWARHRVLRGLSRAEARELLAARAVAAPTRSILDRLMHLTDGNPYFLKELGQLLTEGDVGFDPAGGIALPASLLVVTLQPYHRLSLSCRSLLQAASVVGREFDAELAADAAGLPVREALALLDEAVERRVVAAVGAARYHFAHALVREAVHDQLHPSDRTRLHAHVALALERRAAAGERISAATLAHHFCTGLPVTQRRQAALYGIAAGDAAHAAFAYEEAVFQFRRAEQISGTSLTDLESCDLLLRLGAAEAGAGEWAGSRRTFEDAAGLARRINCPERLAHAALGFKGMMFGTIPIDDEAITLLKESLDRLSATSTSLKARLYSALSRALYFADDPAMVDTYNRLAVEHAHPLTDNQLAAELAETRLLANWRPDSLPTVQQCADELLQLSILLRDPILAVRARIYRYTYLLSFGDTQRAARELRQATELASTTQHPRSNWQISLLRAAQATSRGHLTQGSQFASRARELGRRVHDSSPAHHDLVQSFQHARLTKDYAGWLRVATQSTDQYPSVVGYLAAQALLHAESNHLDDSGESLAHFVKHAFRNIPANNFQLYTLAVLADAVAVCGEASWAQALYSVMLPYEALNVVAGWGTAIDGPVTHYLGLLANCMGNTPLAIAHFQSALETERRLDVPPLLARTQLAFARVTRLSTDVGVRRRSQQLLASAARTFSVLDLRAFRRQCEALLPYPLSDTHRSTTPPAAPESDDFCSLIRHGDLWTLRYEGTTTSIRHMLGLRYLALILRANGESLHVLDLVSQGRGIGQAIYTSPDSGADLHAKQAYKDRLAALDTDIELAHEFNDLGQVERLSAERDRILQELAYSYGLFGKPRRIGSPVEKARISVKNRLSAALAAIKLYHPRAYHHLARSLVTGTYCRYSPAVPTEWQVIVDLKH